MTTAGFTVRVVSWFVLMFYLSHFNHDSLAMLVFFGGIIYFANLDHHDSRCPVCKGYHDEDELHYSEEGWWDGN